MKIKIICDSTAGLKEEYILKYNIKVIPLNVIIDGVSYQDGVDITLDEVMDKFYSGSKVTSSQPAPKLFIEAFEQAKQEGYTDILCFTISSTLSGTYNAAKLSLNEVEGINIHLIDTLSASIGSEMLIHQAIERLEKDESIEEVISYIERLKKNAVILLNMEDLDALKKSGRISKIKAAIGNLIRVKPILEYIGGKLSVISKFRTETAVFNYIVDRIKEEMANVKNKIFVYVSHVRSEMKILKLKKLIESAIENIKVIVSRPISPVVAVNIGYGGYGIAWCYE